MPSHSEEQLRQTYFLGKEYMFKGPGGHSRSFGKDEGWGGRAGCAQVCVGLGEVGLKDGRGGKGQM